MPRDTQTITANDLRKMAADVHKMAAVVESAADQMDKQGIDSLRMAVGVFHTGVTFLRRWHHKQLFPRLLDSVTDRTDVLLSIPNFDPPPKGKKKKG